MRYLVSIGVCVLAALPSLAADFSKGDLVRLTRRETLQFSGKNLVTVPKGGEFTVLKQDGGKLFVEYYKDDDTLIAVTFPVESATAVPREALRPATMHPAAANRAIARGRQAIALRKLFAATKIIDEGLAAEPARPELKALQARVQKDIANADDKYEAAERLRVHGPKGVVHALSALDDGVRLCADHPKLLALKKEMLSAFEERTSPQVTPAFLAANKSAANENLTAGRELYTTRCTECHDLEMLDSRSLDGWQKMVGTMSRRAGLSGPEQARILDYLAAALRAVEAMPAE